MCIRDRCMTCSVCENSHGEEKSKLESKYRENIFRKSESMKATAADKTRASTDSRFMSITFDLQSVCCKFLDLELV